jgi:hypothetical protein
MMFALKGNKSRTIYSQTSREPLEVKGVWQVSGPQVVGGEGGVPEWVWDAFQSNPRITFITVEYEGGGVVYRRPDQEVTDES